ncbi:MAG: hypothetical protein Q9213_005024 [Squamulea squamosa]
MPILQKTRISSERDWSGSTSERELNDRTESPTALQISTILEPWRTPTQREIAERGMIPSVWLRTYYSDGADQKHDELVEYVDMELAVDGENRLLNDPSLYDFGANWQQVFDILPELLEPEEGDWSYHKDKQRQAREELEAFAEGGVARAPKMLQENLATFQGRELEDYMAKALQSAVHESCVISWIILEDEEALTTGKLAVMFLDALGRVVRSSRVGIGEASQISGFWQNGSWNEIAEWEDGELGEDYKDGGACEELLLQHMRSP